MKLRTSRIFALASFAIFSLLISGSAIADDECLRECRGQTAGCLSEAREVFHTCSDGFGCAELRAAYRQACFTRDRDVEACREAALAIKDCVAPCIDGLHQDVGVCRETMDICVEETCGVERPFQSLLERLSRHRR